MKVWYKKILFISRETCEHIYRGRRVVFAFYFIEGLSAFL